MTPVLCVTSRTLHFLSSAILCTCGYVEALTCTPQRLTGKEEIMPFRCVAPFFYYCGDTEINSLEEKASSTSLLTFAPSLALFHLRGTALLNIYVQ